MRAKITILGDGTCMGRKLPSVLLNEEPLLERREPPLAEASLYQPQ